MTNTGAVGAGNRRHESSGLMAHLLGVGRSCEAAPTYSVVLKSPNENHMKPEGPVI